MSNLALLITRRFSLFLMPVLLFCLFTGCSGTDSDSSAYTATIAEARETAARAMAESGATALSLVLVDGEGIVLTESLGHSDRAAGKAVTPETLFCIGSISKMFAAMAVMKLVEQGGVLLDEPLTTYLKQFSMPSPEYRDVTVRMLLNHSSGFPGGDLRNAVTREPFSGLAAQVMDGLKYQRLKHPPGYLNVYNNDGFTMVESLVTALTGTGYPEYVRRKLLLPMGMAGSRYAEDHLPDGSYAKTYTGETPHPYISLNFYGAGGLYSSAADMAKLMMMLINRGAYGATQILSPSSIAAMGRDQTAGTFNPGTSDFIRYGLGWDTVTQAGLGAVGIRGWQKGGAVEGSYGIMYRSTMIVAPEARLGVFAVMASNKISSDLLDKIGERVILRALVEKGMVARMPVDLPQNPLPLMVPTAEEKNTYSGFYAASGAMYRLRFEGPDNSINIDSCEENGWTPKYRGFKKRSDGWYAADGDSATALGLLTASGMGYIAIRKPSGAGHYASTHLMAQKLDDRKEVSAAWRSRLDARWLPVNDDALASYPDFDSDPSFVLTTVECPIGYVRAGTSVLRDMDPPTDVRLDGMFLRIPQLKGRDLVDAAIERREGKDWLRLGSYLYCPLSGISPVGVGLTVVTIGGEGLSEWRKLPVSGSISIDNATAWRLFSSDFRLKASGTGKGTAALPGSGEAAYLALFGPPGRTINVTLAR